MPPEGIDSLDADNLKALVLSLLTRIDELLARIAELEARAGKPPKTPTNSSLPPSSGQKANTANASTTKKGRKGRPAGIDARHERTFHILWQLMLLAQLDRQCADLESNMRRALSLHGTTGE